jgi:hypothetical protein
MAYSATTEDAMNAQDLADIAADLAAARAAGALPPRAPRAPCRRPQPSRHQWIMCAACKMCGSAA